MASLMLAWPRVRLAIGSDSIAALSRSACVLARISQLGASRYFGCRSVVATTPSVDSDARCTVRHGASDFCDTVLAERRCASELD